MSVGIQQQNRPTPHLNELTSSQAKKNGADYDYSPSKLQRQFGEDSPPATREPLSRGEADRGWERNSSPLNTQKGTRKGRRKRFIHGEHGNVRNTYAKGEEMSSTLQPPIAKLPKPFPSLLPSSSVPSVDQSSIASLSPRPLSPVSRISRALLAPSPRLRVSAHQTNPTVLSPRIPISGTLS